jgi:hypothetical protein
MQPKLIHEIWKNIFGDCSYFIHLYDATIRRYVAGVTPPGLFLCPNYGVGSVPSLDQRTRIDG